MIVVLGSDPIRNAIILLVGFGTILVCTCIRSQVSEHVTPAILDSLVFNLIVAFIQIRLTSKLDHR